ncbi:MAG: hypothetical protein KF804_05875 [Burkholderiales bacterium]|nr:hypothetical protein [Burkholderiales bacterium]
MNSILENKFGSVIYERINSVQMSSAERQAAINAMRDADAIVDSILWVKRKIEQVGEFLFMKPSIKH